MMWTRAPGTRHQHQAPLAGARSSTNYSFCCLQRLASARWLGAAACPVSAAEICQYQPCPPSPAQAQHSLIGLVSGNNTFLYKTMASRHYANHPSVSYDNFVSDPISRLLIVG